MNQLKENITNKVNRSNITTILLFIAIGVITYMLVFNNNNEVSRKDRKQTEEKIKELEKRNNELNKELINSYKNIEQYQEKERQWDITDSIRKAELDNAKKETERLERDKIKAQQEREKAQKELEKYKNNPVTPNDLLFLIEDTKKRINEK
jgi:chromosome segregation ATPase